MSYQEKVSLREIYPDDIDKITIWYKNIGGPKFFSRYLPNKFIRFNTLKSPNLFWYIIQFNKKDSGTIWFEREREDLEYFVVDIFLNDRKIFGKGIGKQAIKLAIEKITKINKIKSIYLNVRIDNKRAIRCYKKLGFKKLVEDQIIVKEEKITFQRMKLEIMKS